MPNRLAQESSPYLKQHANNPVDWYPWGDEAISRAKSENKPILLSVGYSACHWCHVMEHESFENAEIARVMNENFINIKVDREERPDVDQIYQNVAQLMTRSGGWPLTVFLTPELKPFFGGTYFPPEDRYGRPGFPKVLDAMANAFKQDAANVAENARRLTQAIGQIEGNQVEGNRRPDAASLRKMVDATISAIDWRYGGFNGAPKFPHSSNLALLWRFGLAHEFGMAQEAVTLTLTRMAEGGIYDHLGGGFHRYSVDERWAVPHFEEMLYDNAQLLKLYSEVVLTGTDLAKDTKTLFLKTIAETTQYVLREMRSKEGAFFSTQDADSEGEEGKFFVWNPAEVHKHVSKEEAEAFLYRYGVDDVGNFEDSRQTVLYAAMPVTDVAARMQLGVDRVEQLLASAKEKLFKAREARVHPGLDDKRIASWNGLMISALSWASRALRENNQGALGEEALESAINAMNFIRSAMSHGTNRLYSVHRDGKSRFNAYLDDYAFLAMGAIDLSRMLDEQGEIDSLLSQARQWVDVVRTHFVDKDRGGFYFTSDDHEKLIQRPKSLYDQAIPSGNAVTIECMLALAEMFEGTSYEAEADEHLYKLYPTAEQAPLGMGQLACTALLYITGPVTVSGQSSSLACVHPHVFQKPPIAAQREVKAEPASKDILVCHRKTCDIPMIDPMAARKAALKKALSA